VRECKLIGIGGVSGRGFFPLGGLNLKNEREMIFPGIFEGFMDKAGVVFHHPISRELVRTGQDKAGICALDESDGINPQRKPVFWKNRFDICFDVVPDDCHDEALQVYC
jgi:hypothetical protein